MIMLGGLHIERTSMKLLGDLLKGSAWVTVLTETEVAFWGSAESFLTGCNVAKTRQVHQLLDCSVFEILKRAFKNSAECSVNLDDIDVKRVVLKA